jgi:hypothetical protein
MRDQDIRKSHIQFDYEFARDVKKAGVTITCKAGCSACCWEPLYVFDYEARHLIKHIPTAEMPGVVERTKVWAEKATSCGILAKAQPHVQEYRYQKMACPLLKDNKCLVYKERPFGCRSHCAIGDPKLCHDDQARMQQRFVYSRILLNKHIRDGAVGDHLGVFISNVLTGTRLQSADRTHV